MHNENDVKIATILAVVAICAMLAFVRLVENDNLAYQTLKREGYVYVPAGFSTPAKWIKGEGKP